MKKLLILLFFSYFFSQNIFAQIVGGGGVCHVNSDPNTITAIATQNQGACKRALNTLTGWQYYYDDTRAVGTRWVLEQKNFYEVRILPTVANTIVDIGTFTINNAGANIEISINFQGAGFARTKFYVVPINNNFPTGTWFSVQPLQQTKIETAALFQANLIIQQVGSTVYRFAIQRTAGAAAATAYINMTLKGIAQGISFSPTSATSAIALVNSLYSVTNATLRNVHVVTASTAFTLQMEQDILIFKHTGSSVIVTLPAATTSVNKIYSLVNVSALNVLLAGSFRVSNTTTAAFIGPGVRATIVSDGTEWVQIQ